MEIIIKNVRLSFPNLFHAKEFKPGDGKPRWAASFVVEPGSEADKFIRNAIETEAKNVWGAKAAAMLKTMDGQNNKYCYSDGDTKTNDEFQGMMVLTTYRSAKLARPLVIDRDKSPLTSEDGKPYAGCYVNAKVDIYIQTGENAGVRCSFSTIQFAKDGDAFAAGSVSDEGFDDLSVSEETAMDLG